METMVTPRQGVVARGDRAQGLSDQSAAVRMSARRIDVYTALTIGGSDPSGGGGIQADLKTFTVLGVYGMAVITRLTAQNTTGVTGSQVVDIPMVQKQIDAIAADLPINAFKTGLLATAPMIGAIAESIQRNALDNYVCDPVVFGKSGQLLDGSAIHAYRKELLPLARVVTPNRAEAALLANLEFDEVTDTVTARKAAEKIIKSGARSVIIKGLCSADTIVDLFYDGDHFVEFKARRVATKNTQGSGSMFAAILTALLAQEIDLLTAVDNTRSFISQAINHHVKLGSGIRPVNPLALTPQ
jgi:hydroxymethylpyrimidine/phosphomethylpyrimidine kinase